MEATLQAQKRETRGKNEARRLRASNRIPAVLYGAEKGKAVEIAVDPKELGTTQFIVNSRAMSSHFVERSKAIR